MNRVAIKGVGDLAGLAAQARSGQITLLLGEAGEPAAFLASGLCSRSDLTSALLATRPACPGEVRVERRKLAHQWQAVIQKVRERNVVVVVQGRVLAGIIADSGPAVKETIKLGNDARRERDAAIVAGREIQLRKRNQVVARIVSPARIPDFLPGWTVPEAEPLSQHKARGDEKRRQVMLRAELRGSRKSARRADYDTSELAPASIDDRRRAGVVTANTLPPEPFNARLPPGRTARDVANDQTVGHCQTSG